MQLTISNNPDFVVNGFLHAGNSQVQDGNTTSAAEFDADATGVSEESDVDNDDNDEGLTCDINCNNYTATLL